MIFKRADQSSIIDEILKESAKLSKTSAKRYVTETCNLLMKKYPSGLEKVRVYLGKDFKTYFVPKNGEYVVPKYDIRTEGYNDFLHVLEELIRPEWPGSQKEINKTWNQLYKDNNIVRIEEGLSGDKLTDKDGQELAEYLEIKIECVMACSIDPENVNDTVMIYSGAPIAYVKNDKIEFDKFEEHPFKNLSKNLPKPWKKEQRFEFNVIMDFGTGKIQVKEK